MSKAENPTTNAQGYELVLAHFGKRHGAKTKLAEALGVTRQVVNRWQTHGIPQKYLPQLRQITGLSSAQIMPELFQ